MDSWPAELRLLVAVGTNAAVLAAAWRTARRVNDAKPAATAADTLLIFYLIQYVIVGVLGLVGALNPPVVAMVSVAVAAIVWQVAGGQRPPDRRLLAAGYWPAKICVLVVFSYLAALAWSQWLVPQIANDVLTYHLPAAVQWLEHGRLTLYQTWLYNPANTYSPLAGSMFAAWLMAPLGNDVLAKFVQMPALMLTFFAAAQVCSEISRRLPIADCRLPNEGRAAIGNRQSAIGNCDLGPVPMLVATSVVLSRPFISQAILAKDDLFVAAFFAAAVAGLSSEKLRQRIGPWRIGVALGLMLATKYTALLSVPLLLLAIDAPFRAGWKWRQWVIVVLCATALAGPWYVRNLVLTGNPVFPVAVAGLNGIFVTQRSDELRTLGGVFRTLAGGYYGTTPILWGAVVIGWAMAIARFRGQVWRRPLLRICAIGPIVGIGIFVLVSPYAEVRFVLPSLLLLMACAAAHWSGAILLLVVALATNFKPMRLTTLLPDVGLVLIVMAGATAAWWYWRRAIVRLAMACAAILLAAAWVFVNWQASLNVSQTGTAIAWRDRYGPVADAWEFVRNELPVDATLAYANTFYVYPLYGFDLRRPVVYVPLRADLKHIHDLPRIQRPLRGEEIDREIGRITTAEADRAAWNENLRAAGAEYLFVVKNGDVAERRFAESDAERFRPLFENEAAVVYGIRW